MAFPAPLLGLWLLILPLAATAASQAPWRKTESHPEWRAVAGALRKEAAEMPIAVPRLEGPLAWNDPKRAARFEAQRKRLSALQRRLGELRKRLLALPVPEKRGPRPERLPLVDPEGRRLCEAPRALLLHRWLAVDHAAPLRTQPGEPPYRRAARIMGWRELAGRYLALIGATTERRRTDRRSPLPAAGASSVAGRLRKLLDDAARLLERRSGSGAVPALVTGEGERRLLEDLRTRTYDRILAPFIDRIARLEGELAGAHRRAGAVPPAPQISTAAIAPACRRFGVYRERLRRLLDGPGLVGVGRRTAGFYMNLLLPLEGLCIWAQAENLPDRRGMSVSAGEEAWARWHRRTWIGLYLSEMGWTLVDPLGIEENLDILETMAARSLPKGIVARLEEAEPLSAPALEAWDGMLARRMEVLLVILAERAAWYARLASLPDMHPGLLRELRDGLAGKLAVLGRYVDARDDLRIYMTTPTAELLKRKLGRLPGIGREVRRRLAADNDEGTAARAQERAVTLALAALRRSGVDPMVYLSPKRPPASPLKVLLDDVGEEELNGILDHLHLRRYFLGRLRYRLSEPGDLGGLGCGG